MRRVGGKGWIDILCAELQLGSESSVRFEARKTKILSVQCGIYRDLIFEYRTLVNMSALLVILLTFFASLEFLFWYSSCFALELSNLLNDLPLSTSLYGYVQRFRRGCGKIQLDFDLCLALLC